MTEITPAMIDRAARAVYDVTAGGIPFGKVRRGKAAKVTVHAALVAEVALEAALNGSDGCSKCNASVAA